MAKASSRKRRAQRRSNFTIWIIVGAIGAVLLVALLVWANQPPGPPPAAALDKCGHPECGQANAPVTVEEYSDFQ